MIDNKLKNEINSHNVLAIRNTLCNRLLLDHNCTSGLFNECMDECKKCGITGELYERHDGRPLSKENTKDNFQTLVGQLSTNFSEERVDRIVEIAKFLWKDEQKAKERVSPSKNDFYSEDDDEEIVDEEIVGERIIGERIISEREIGGESSGAGSKAKNQNASSNKSDSGVLIGVAVAAAVVVAGVAIAIAIAIAS